MKTFIYRKSIPIIHWGCSFDSLLELKYAISIRDDYEFLRAHIPIYYDPKTKVPTNYIRDNIRRYTPDFLIRHKQTNKAYWVELKPRAFNNNTQLELRREVAERYIKWKQYDWIYKVVYDNEIRLNAAQYKLFNECNQLRSKSARKLAFVRQNNRFDRSQPTFFKAAPRNAEVTFVMFGSVASGRIP